MLDIYARSVNEAPNAVARSGLACVELIQAVRRTFEIPHRSDYGRLCQGEPAGITNCAKTIMTARRPAIPADGYDEGAARFVVLEGCVQKRRLALCGRCCSRSRCRKHRRSCLARLDRNTLQTLAKSETAATREAAADGEWPNTNLTYAAERSDSSTDASTPMVVKVLAWSLIITTRCSEGVVYGLVASWRVSKFEATVARAAAKIKSRSSKPPLLRHRSSRRCCAASGAPRTDWASGDLDKVINGESDARPLVECKLQSIRLRRLSCEGGSRAR